VYNRFVAMADKQKVVTDSELIFIVESSKETPAAI
jgi:hypothetical protein